MREARAVITTRRALPEDRAQLASMRHALWPEGSVEEHEAELAEILGGTIARPYPYAIFVAESDGALVGFAEATLRSYAEGCDETRPAAHLEGWFVTEQHRRSRVGAALLLAVEQWGREQGCDELASDTWLDNEGSQRAHEALGFEEVVRSVHYRKPL